MEHLRKALTQCKYQKLALDRVEKLLIKPPNEVSNGADSQGTTGAQPTTNEVKTKGHIVILYTQGLCKNIMKICSRCAIQTHFKVSPKDKNLVANKSGAIYWFQCGDLTCNNEYIGETSRTIGERFKEHLKEPSPIHHYSIYKVTPPPNITSK